MTEEFNPEKEMEAVGRAAKAVEDMDKADGALKPNPPQTANEIIYNDIETRFTYHKPNAFQADLYDNLRRRIRELAHYFTGVLPVSREKSLAITKLEEAMFWANASVARSAHLYQDYRNEAINKEREPERSKLNDAA